MEVDENEAPRLESAAVQPPDAKEAVHSFASEDGLVVWALGKLDTGADCYFPITIINLEYLKSCGFKNQLKVGFLGHISQIYVGGETLSSLTPQNAMPVQETKSSTSGYPDLTSRKEVEKITILFALGQSNG